MSGAFLGLFWGLVWSVGLSRLSVRLSVFLPAQRPQLDCDEQAQPKTLTMKTMMMMMMMMMTIMTVYPPPPQQCMFLEGNAARFFGLPFFSVHPRFAAEFVSFSPLYSDSSSGRTPSLMGWGSNWGCVFLCLGGENAVRFLAGFFFGKRPLFLTKFYFS